MADAGGQISTVFKVASESILISYGGKAPNALVIKAVFDSAKNLAKDFAGNVPWTVTTKNSDRAVNAAWHWAKPGSEFDEINSAKQLDVTKFGPNPKIREVLVETLQGRGNLTSKVVLTADEALNAGIRWVGRGYSEIENGVFRSSDELRQFRMDKNSIIGAHSPGKPHIHFETYQESARKLEANDHIIFED